jgi:hypothetical protein
MLAMMAGNESRLVYGTVPSFRGVVSWGCRVVLCAVPRMFLHDSSW